MSEENHEQGLQIIESTALEAMERASIDVQIATARRYPRDFALVKKKMISLATLDEETAASCFYKLNRQGKNIEGPSVRMAEIAVSCFGNMRAGSRIIGNDGRTITAQAFCHDLENNTLIAVEVKRRITDRSGKTYSDDMQVVTGNAACAIAFRNATYKVVPFALIKPVYEQAKRVAVGDIKTLTERRTASVKYFASLGVTEKQVLDYLGRTGMDAVDLTDLETLIGLTTALKDGSTTVDEAFSGAPKGTVTVQKVAAANHATGAQVAAGVAPSVGQSFTRNAAAGVSKGAANPPPDPEPQREPAETPPRATPAQGVRNLCASAQVSEPTVLAFLRSQGAELGSAETLDEVDEATLQAFIAGFVDCVPALQKLEREGARQAGEPGEPEPVDEAAENRAKVRQLLQETNLTEEALLDYLKQKKHILKSIRSIDGINAGRLEWVLGNWSVIAAVLEMVAKQEGAVSA